MIFHILGWVLTFEGLFFLLPLICALIYGEKEIGVFAVSVLICIVVGALLKLKKPKTKSLYAREGLVIVSLSWIVLSIFGSMPFIISGAIMNPADAFFETVSGFTTTGASILSDVEVLPRSILFWRSFTHWIGGMGVLVFLMAVLPLSGGYNMYLMRAESPGPMVGKLVPRVRDTAKILYAIYIGMTILQIVMLFCGGMPLFDSIVLTFGTAGTGGFGIKNDSIAGYSQYSQIVITFFMFLFGINFSVYYLMLSKKFREAFKMSEVKCYIGTILVATAIICFNIYNMYSGIGESLIHSVFQVVSIITTTGYVTTDYDTWPTLSKTVLFLLMFIGACAGSTGGGIKVSRIIVIVKTIIKELIVVVSPRSVIKVKMDGETIPHENVRNINVFLAIYFFMIALSTLLISVDNFDLTTNLSAAVTTINNVGPGFEIVGPTRNFSEFSDFSKIILSINMLIGRLEIFPMLILFSPVTWKKS